MSGRFSEPQDPAFRALDTSLGYDRRLFTAWPAAGLATCLFQQGRHAEARDWFGRAEADDPGELEYRVKRRLCASLLAAGGGPAAVPHPEPGSDR